MESAQQEYQSMNPARRSPQVEHKYSSVVEKWEQLWALSNIYVERYYTLQIHYIVRLMQTLNVQVQTFSGGGE